MFSNSFFFFYKNKVRDMFFGLVPVHLANAETLFNSIVELFKKNKISLENIGFAADNDELLWWDRNQVPDKITEN